MAITKKSFIIYSGILSAALYFNHQGWCRREHIPSMLRQRKRLPAVWREAYAVGFVPYVGVSRRDMISGDGFSALSGGVLPSL